MITNSSSIPFCVFIFSTLLFLIALSTLILAILSVLTTDKTKNWVIGTFGIIYTLGYLCVSCYYFIKFCTQYKQRAEVVQPEVVQPEVVQVEVVQVEGGNNQHIIQVENCNNEHINQVEGG
jgi:hypothetical protein